MCLHAYAVSLAGAGRMLQAMADCPGMCPADCAAPGLEWASNGSRMGLEWDSNGPRMGLE